MSFYQPAAMIFISLIVLDLFMSTTKSLKRLAGVVIYKLTLSGVAMGCYYVFFKVFMKIVGCTPNMRVGLTTNIPAKVQYFWRSVFRYALEMYYTYPSDKLINISFYCLIAGLIIYPFLRKGVLRFYWFKFFIENHY
jgi:hypothetical protein